MKPKRVIKGTRAAIRHALCSHARVIYGPMRDICIDCLAIVDEHPHGRGRAALTPETKGGDTPYDLLGDGAAEIEDPGGRR
jgi:hypothetical protein